MALLAILFAMVVLLGFVSLPLVVLPLSYVRLCRKMIKARAGKGPLLLFFFAFGTLGGGCMWLFVSLPVLSSPLAAYFYPLVMLASMCALLTTFAMSFKKDQGPYQIAAMTAGLAASIPFIASATIILYEAIGTHLR